MPHFLDIRVNGIAPLLSVKASKNFVLLRVVASRSARGDRGGVRYGFNRVGGAIITKGCCVVKNKGETRFSLLVGLTNPHRIRAPTVGPHRHRFTAFNDHIEIISLFSDTNAG